LQTNFSHRARWNALPNRLAVAREERRRTQKPELDLTESNPTRTSIAYPLDELSDALARAARAPYEPAPLGLASAREAVASTLACDADDIVITASTSEAYSFLFKLLTDPGDAILTATPTYPLLEHLAALELIELRSFALEFQRRWEIDARRARTAVTPRTRAIVVVSPNNPTGSYASAAEQDALAELGIPIISDEVFRPYAFGAAPPSLVREDVLAFTLGGLSKSAGLPHYKLGWIRVSGPSEAKRVAIAALELIADNFLSVATPVQQALPELLRIGAGIRDAIRARTRENLDVITRAIELVPAARLLPVEGGWTAVVRMPHLESDEEFALRLLEEHGVFVHPGYFFDFERDGYLVVSLLTRPDVFVEGVARLVEAIPR
jgi:aspartate/methionine/tyrosine aminotransferase